MVIRGGTGIRSSASSIIPRCVRSPIALLKRFGLTEAEADDYGVPSRMTFWVEEFDDDDKLVTVGRGSDGYDFFGTFTFDPAGKFKSHGFAE